MSVVSPATHMLLNLSMLKGVGPAALKKALAMGRLETRGIEEFAFNVPQIERALSSENEWVVAQGRATAQIEQAELHKARIISPADSDYPSLLAATRDDPCILYVKGTLWPTQERSVAIIGTRQPTKHGEMIGRRITQFFVEQGWSVVSGLAIGCDAIAHEAALESKGHTVAVLAHGLQMIAPSRHKKLAEDILASGGALVSEYPFGQNVQNQQYVKRDRTQAGMAQGVVMVQSDLKGGSLHASRAALDYDRWLAVPFPTERDRESREPKVQANLIIAEGTDSERTDLLRCKPGALRRIITLRGKDDYLLMISKREGRTDVPAAGRNGKKDHAAHSQPVMDLFGEKHRTEIGDFAQMVSNQVVSMFSELKTSEQAWEIKPQNYRILFDRHEDSSVSISRLLSEISRKLLAQVLIDRSSELTARLQFIQNQIDTVTDWSTASPRQDTSYVLVCLEEAVGQMKRVVNGLEPWNNFHSEHLKEWTMASRQASRHTKKDELLMQRCSHHSHRASQEAFSYLLDPDISTAGAGNDGEWLYLLGVHQNAAKQEAVIHFSDLVCSFNQLVEATLVDEKTPQLRPDYQAE